MIGEEAFTDLAVEPHGSESLRSLIGIDHTDPLPAAAADAGLDVVAFGCLCQSYDDIGVNAMRDIPPDHPWWGMRWWISGIGGSGRLDRGSRRSIQKRNPAELLTVR